MSSGWKPTCTSLGSGSGASVGLCGVTNGSTTVGVAAGGCPSTPMGPAPSGSGIFGSPVCSIGVGAKITW
ncbi:unnamed protein product [Adineta steineri]|uniref:Uncharacterized protein n=1 Tax=Adineta steineri TaxID=433720 RepID=A0A818NJF4_9BILA|nr:unnamed protein product [Adineta steineri]CAF1279301.1 unnamed protein product [Adineta steineri]CAF3606235.1 unnamed protein product [Adineta steineri]CAF3720129.1 unnamed protein product [Adineta steineri]